MGGFYNDFIFQKHFKLWSETWSFYNLFVLLLMKIIVFLLFLSSLLIWWLTDLVVGKKNVKNFVNQKSLRVNLPYSKEGWTLHPSSSILFLVSPSHFSEPNSTHWHVDF